MQMGKYLGKSKLNKVKFSKKKKENIHKCVDWQEQ